MSEISVKKEIGIMQSAEEWLENEDRRCWEDRLKRLKWSLEKYPKIAITLFHGGIKSYYLFEEARYCFIYGQYIASILLCLSYIENTLGSVFYAAGRNDLEKARIVDLLKEAKEKGLISESEFKVFEKIRKIRNPIIHFRRPSDRETLEYKAVDSDRDPYEIFEEDAKIALKANFRLMGKFSIRENS